MLSKNVRGGSAHTFYALIRLAQTPHQPATKKRIVHVGEQLGVLQPISQLFRILRRMALLRGVTIEIELPLQLLPLLIVDGIPQMEGKIDDIVLGHEQTHW